MLWYDMRAAIQSSWLFQPLRNKIGAAIALDNLPLLGASENVSCEAREARRPALSYQFVVTR